MKKLMVFHALLFFPALTGAGLASTVSLQASVQGSTKTGAQWLEQLKSKDAKARTEAAKELGEMKDAGALDALVAALKDRDDDVRAQAAESLGKIKDARAINPLIRALREEYWLVQEKVIDALVAIGAPAIEPLIAAIGEVNPGVRNGAISVLTRIGEPAVEPLLPALKSANPIVRRGAADALSEIESPRAAEALSQGLKAKDLAVIAGAYAHFDQGDQPLPDSLIIRALNGYGTQEMAEHYLDDERKQVKAAVRAWLRAKGFRFVSYLTTSGMRRGIEPTARTPATSR